MMLEPSFEQKELPYVVQLEAIMLSEGEYRGNLFVEPLVDDVNDDKDCGTVATKAGKVYSITLLAYIIMFSYHEISVKNN